MAIVEDKDDQPDDPSSLGDTGSDDLVVSEVIVPKATHTAAVRDESIAYPLNYSDEAETPDQQGESVRWFGYIAVAITLFSLFAGVFGMGWLVYRFARWAATDS